MKNSIDSSHLVYFRTRRCIIELVVRRQFAFLGVGPEAVVIF